ncbi:MAG: hypothetical protein A3C06_00360 [Candidatus Taylorbacteria bacterium RIFCSPHIGHO2_02_FULL_46_13]|uniref:Cell division protein FtsL n=1 Tax=Candidatus Taylorbacteria bacterium RIFCSPHIGHO2_02_FULL_46_13 TaxID=1802312 RepID=A0A1G2MQ73_9BACT|nr:MAG: hypothetical protein A3C06_00360 [Candidatus Taylorbacteria bacterium RIFCSPHIGHO2_02_FULL_46_13]
MKRVVENAIESTVVRALLAWALVGACLFSAFLYTVLVNKAIFQTVETKHVRSKMSEMSSGLNSLEERYLSLQKTATLQKALELGFAETENPKFVSRKSLGKGISVRDEL